ncbi:MAG: hypothetical protein HC904_14500 [Blastochloris sp.]|nr:hypothetical protein [Blastochloris sp.]
MEQEPSVMRPWASVTRRVLRKPEGLGGAGGAGDFEVFELQAEGEGVPFSSHN